MKKYEKPEMIATLLDGEDILTASGELLKDVSDYWINDTIGG